MLGASCWPLICALPSPYNLHHKHAPCILRRPPCLLMQLRIPRVVGMLGAGILLANVPGGVVSAFPAKWGTQMRAAALATIFLRCGLELEFKVGGHACAHGLIAAAATHDWGTTKVAVCQGSHGLSSAVCSPAGSVPAAHTG